MCQGYVGDEGGENQRTWLENVVDDDHRQGEDCDPGGVCQGWHSLKRVYVICDTQDVLICTSDLAMATAMTDQPMLPRVDKAIPTPYKPG